MIICQKKKLYQPQKKGEYSVLIKRYDTECTSNIKKILHRLNNKSNNDIKITYDQEPGYEMYDAFYGGRNWDKEINGDCVIYSSWKNE